MYHLQVKQDNSLDTQTYVAEPCEDPLLDVLHKKHSAITI
jgi:hypothetical protein